MEILADDEKSCSPQVITSQLDITETILKISQQIRKLIDHPHTKEFLTLAVIFTISLLIRSIGLKHGFPLLTHPDESVILEPVYQMTRNRSLNPGFFNRPNHTLHMMNFFYLNVLSYVRFGASFATTFRENHLSFYYYSRLLISIMGALIPVTAYKIGKIIKPELSLVTGLVFMAFPSYVFHSLFITPDVPITLFTLLVIYFTLRFAIENERIALYIAILFSAINTAEKYPGLLSLSIVFFGIIAKTLEETTDPLPVRIRQIIKQLLGASFSFFIALFLVAPNLFFNYQKVIEAIINESRSSHLGADQLGLIGRLLFYIRAFGSWTNLLAVLFLGLGVVFLIKWRNHKTIILLYGLLYWFALSILALHWERWALPMYITPLFLIAIGISQLWNHIRTMPKLRWLVIIIIALFFFQQFTFSLHTSAVMAYTDTRVVSKAYCHQKGITSRNSIFEGYTPLLPQFPKDIFEDYEEKSRKSEYDFIILSSQMYDRFFQEPERYQDEINIYKTIRNTYPLLMIFEPVPPAENVLDMIEQIRYLFRRSTGLPDIDPYRGPTIEIYQLAN